MPSGPKKRKAAKKKQVKGSGNSNSSSTTHSHHGESDGGELISPVTQQNHQLPFAENIEIDKGSKKSTKSHDSSSNSDDGSNVIEKEVVPVVELIQPIEAFPEKKGQQFQEDPSVLDPIKPTNSQPQDINDDLKIEDNGCSDVNDKPEISECSDKQPLVTSAPQAVQTTSWKGCCGIFELFSSSDR